MICAPQTTPPTLFIFLHKTNKKEKKKKDTCSYKSQTGRTLSTYHKPRLQQCIQRMQPTEGTHHWLHNSQRAETRTCHPEEREKNKAEFISSPVRKEKTEVEEGIWWAGRRELLTASQQRQSSTGAEMWLKHRWPLSGKRHSKNCSGQRAGCQWRKGRHAISGLENAAANRRVESPQRSLCRWPKISGPRL